MSTRTRYFVIGAGLVLTVGLGTGLVAMYSGALPHAGKAAGLEVLGYVPADSTVVAYANVRDIMSSEFRQKMRQVLPSGSERDQFQAETGIDIEHDIDYVVGAVRAGTPNAAGFVLVHTTAAPGQIETFLQQHGATAADYHGKHVLVVKEHSQDTTDATVVPAEGSHHGVAVAFLEQGLIAIGEEGSVQRSIDAKTGANVAGNQEMMQYINDAQGQLQNAWAVGRFDGVPQTFNLPAPVTSQLSTIQWFSVVGHVDGGVSGRVRVDARDEAAAENLRDIVRGGLALARLQVGHDSKIDNVINSLQMQGSGKTIELSFAVPSEIFDVINGVAGLAHLGNDTESQKEIKNHLNKLDQHLKDLKKDQKK